MQTHGSVIVQNTVGRVRRCAHKYLSLLRCALCACVADSCEMHGNLPGKAFIPRYCNLNYLKPVCLIWWSGRGVSVLFGGRRVRGTEQGCGASRGFNVKIWCFGAAQSGCSGAGAQGGLSSIQAPLQLRVRCDSEPGHKVRLGAFVNRRNVYLTSSKATNKYKKLIGKVLTGS